MNLIATLGGTALWHDLAHAVGNFRQALCQLLRYIGIQPQVQALRERDVGRLEGACACAQDAAVGRIATGKHQHRRHDGLGFEGLQHGVRHQVLRHARGGCGSQAVHADVVLGAFNRQGLHQSDQGHFGRTVVGLAKVAIQATAGGGHHNAAVLLRRHVRPHRLAAMHGPHQVHVHHQLEVGNLHLGKAFVTQDAGVVDQNVHAAPSVNRLLNHGLHGGVVSDGSTIGNSFTTCGVDFVHHGLRRTDGGTNAIARAAQVIHHHFGTALGQCQRV